MKLNKLVSFTLLNAFGLFVLATLLVSCQKRLFPKLGLLTSLESPSRSIASFKKVSKKERQLKRFKHFQDPKQILIYCKLNSHLEKSCYQDLFHKALSQYVQQSRSKEVVDIEIIQKSFNHKNTSSELSNILAILDKKIIPNVEKITTTRENFCSKNSSKFLEKCLNQYIDKDTFHVLNKFHHHYKMNGHEYLYIKGRIKKQFQDHFQKAQKSIELKHSKKI